MKFTRIVADLKETNVQLQRIADALEVIVLKEYGWNMKPSKSVPEAANPEEEIGYYTDLAALRQEFEDTLKMGEPGE